MNLSEAERILGIKAGASAEDVRAAFAAKVKASHPDSVSYTVEDAVTMVSLKKARDLLLERAGSTSNAKACPVCKGTGVQVIGLRRTPCVRGCEED